MSSNPEEFCIEHAKVANLASMAGATLVACVRRMTEIECGCSGNEIDAEDLERRIDIIMADLFGIDHETALLIKGVVSP